MHSTHKAQGGERERWVPIEDYAAVGDGRTVALIARDGRVDWLPMPRLDTRPVFAAVLDPDHGGFIELGPLGDRVSERRYLPGSNVLETVHRTDAGTLRVTDGLSVGMAGPLPWSELVRRVEVVDGEVEVGWRVVPGTELGATTPWIFNENDRIVAHAGDHMVGVRAFDLGEPQVSGAEVCGRRVMRAGETAVLGLTATEDGQLWLPGRQSLLERLDRTVRRWQEWCELIDYPADRWRDAVLRSALAMKLLLFAPTGALAAAGTTSLPEVIGGNANWDYRFMWVRDASYTADALMRLGLSEEVHAGVSWLLDSVRATAPDVHVLYTLEGRAAGSVEELPLPGYRDSQPVRSGNDAEGQRQLGTFGDLFDTVWTYVCRDHVLDEPVGRMLAMLADRCCDVWRLPDSGLWELPERRQYTVSKMGCWVALDRAIQLAEGGQIPTTHRGRWAAERDNIKQWVEEHCWSPTKQSYTFYAGSDELDASVLIAGQIGFERGERLSATCDAIRTELSEGPLVWRYTGMRGHEGAFVACSFWLVSALAHCGRRDEAFQLMDEAVGLGNDVGLLSEQVAAPGRLLGNLPQALSHLALVNAATTLCEVGDADGG